MSMITPEIERYLAAARIPVRLSCLTSEGWPLVLSLWFLYGDGALYCATQEGARVVQHLRRDPRCAFEVASDQPPYCGVRGRALATIEPAQGPAILARLLERYLGGTESALAQRLLSRSDSEVAIRLEPQTLYTWNFTERMQDVAGAAAQKPCP